MCAPVKGTPGSRDTIAKLPQPIPRPSSRKKTDDEFDTPPTISIPTLSDSDFGGFGGGSSGGAGASGSW